MTIRIDKDAKVPVYLQIADQIKAQIISGALPRGGTLPSERALAQILDVHRNTVVKAYSELKSDAWVELCRDRYGGNAGEQGRRRAPARGARELDWRRGRQIPRHGKDL